MAPLFSVITPVYNTPPQVLQKMIRSVVRQSFREFELILVDDGSPSSDTQRVLDEEVARDERVRVVRRATNGGIVAASNDGIACASAPFVALVDHDDLLALNALATMAKWIEGHQEVDYLYSDEDKIDGRGRQFAAFRKPDWSPERFRHQMYTCHLSVLRTDLVKEVGGFRTGYDGSQDHDLVLRVTERAREIVHVPEILYHWRVLAGSAAGDAEAKPYAWAAGLRAVQDHLERTGLPATASLGPTRGFYTVTRRPECLPTASLIIPTNGSKGTAWGEPRHFVVEAVRTALVKTRLDPEVVVVYDRSTPDEVLTQLRETCGSRLVLVPYRDDFNFSAKCNLGFVASSGDAVVLLNDDIEAVTEGWLEELLGPLTEPDVGMTGARLLFSDGTLQHAGHLYAKEHVHAYYGELPRPGLDHGAVVVNREVSGVTAACAALRREVYEEVGGMFTGLPHSYNDVDLSFKVRHRGYRIVWVAGAELYHFESRSRVPDVHDWERAAVRRRWGTSDTDPYTRPDPHDPTRRTHDQDSSVESRSA